MRLGVGPAADRHLHFDQPASQIVAIRHGAKQIFQDDRSVPRGMVVRQKLSEFRLGVGVVRNELHILLKATDGQFKLVCFLRATCLLQQEPALPIDLHGVQHVHCRAQQQYTDKQDDEKAPIDSCFHGLPICSTGQRRSGNDGLSKIEYVVCTPRVVGGTYGSGG